MTKSKIPTIHLPIKPCSVEGCKNRRDAKGFCAKHYSRWRKYGNASITKLNCGEGNTKQERFWAKVAITANPDKCWEWQGVTLQGYGLTSYKNKNVRSTRLAWFLVKGVFPEKHLLHSCDNPLCCNPNHLREGTQQENVDDMIKRGRNAVGSQLPQSKLTAEDVREIRRLLQAKNKQSLIANQFNIDQSVISDIKRGKIWKQVI